MPLDKALDGDVVGVGGGEAASRHHTSLTIVLTEWIAIADDSISSTRAITSSLNGIDTEHPRMPSARTPPIAAAMSVVVNAL